MTDAAGGGLAPVFVVGCPRSGTTLLQQLLSRHPDLVVAPETHFVRRFLLEADRYGDLHQDAAMHRLLDDVVAMPELVEMRVDPDLLRARCLAGPRSADAVFATLLRCFGEAWGAPVVGEKTPNHVLYLRRLEQVFPDARFVHIVRDPRAVVASWRHVPWSTGSVAGDTRVWRRYVAAARRQPPRHAPLHQLRYEDLVAEPERVVAGLVARLGLARHPTGVGADAPSERAGLVDVAREPWKTGSDGPVRAEAADRWRSALSAAEVLTVERSAWRLMRAYGYAPDHGPLALAPGLLVGLPAAVRRRVRR